MLNFFSRLEETNPKRIDQTKRKMALYANLRSRIIPSKALHVKRTIVGKGAIYVTKGQEVASHDVIGKTYISPGFSSISVTSRLGINPIDCTKYLQKPIGSRIYKGELLAVKKTIFGKKLITAPTDGTLEQCDPRSGRLLLRFPQKELPIVSGVFGIVDDVNENTHEVTIKTIATEVFGIAGSGNERSGVLKIIAGQSGFTQASQINTDLRQKIIVTGGLIYGEALRKAATMRISGIISGGINSADHLAKVSGANREFKDVGFSVVVTEGFGPIPIGDDIFKLLQEYENRFVFIHGNTNQLILPCSTSDCIVALRKISIPIKHLPALSPEIDSSLINISAYARIIWPPFMGTIGKIIAIDERPTLLDSGIMTYLVTLETSKQKIKVPFANLELI